MLRRLPCVVLIALGAIACEKKTPPTPSPGDSPGETITGRERIGWDQQASSASELSTFRYAIYTDGARTTRLVERLRRGQLVRDEDLCNVFEAVLPDVDPEGAAAFNRAGELEGAPHLCGSGPAFFTLATDGTHILSAADASRFSEVG